MQSVNLFGNGLKQLTDRFDEILKKIPESKRKMFEEIGAAVQYRVQSNIGGSGKVKSWQNAYIGSKSGYAAVRAKAETYDIAVEGKQRYAVGHITNSIENGHKQGKGRYVPHIGKRLKSEKVAGRGFYASARPEAEHIAYQAAEAFLKSLKERL